MFVFCEMYNTELLFGCIMFVVCDQARWPSVKSDPETKSHHQYISQKKVSMNWHKDEM